MQHRVPDAIPETWPVKYPGAAWVRLFFFSLIGVAPAPVVVTALLGIDVADWTGLDHDLDVVILGASASVLLASIVLPLVCLKIREPGPAKLVFDGWGVTEWDGDRVRTAISWARAKMYLLEIRVRDRWGSVYAGGMNVSIASDRGWAVNIAWGRRMMKNGWRRRMTSTVEFPPQVLQRFTGSVQRMELPASDPRDLRRGLFWYARTVGFFYLAAIGGALAQIGNLGPNGQLGVGFFFSVGAILALMRMARPIGENVRLSREGKPCAWAIPIVLQSGSDGPFVMAQAEDGRQLSLDFSMVNHPDELLVRRGGRMWVALDGASAGDAYRGAPMRLLAAETDGDRRERARIRRANRIEILMRVNLGLGLLVSAGILLAGIQVH